jgi:FkbM family methyltransferase
VRRDGLRQLAIRGLNKAAWELESRSDDERMRLIRRFHEDERRRALRFDYPLDSTSVVMDVGGYEGQWASDIFARYACTVHVYEPVTEFATKIADRFRSNPQVVVHPYGLSDTGGDGEIFLADDASSTQRGTQAVTTSFEAVADEMQRIGEVDLMKLNIEGDEFPLIESLIDSGAIARVRFLLVQFHLFVPDAERRRDTLRDRLRQTHEEQWDYPFVWESWSRTRP